MGLSAAARARVPAATLFGVLLLAAAAGPGAAPAQEPLRAPSGATLEVPRDTLLRMLEETRAYRDTLVEDPDVLYYTGFAAPVSDSAPSAALPWNAVEVWSDSVARVATPGNLREGDLAYRAYGVARMTAYRDRDRDAEPSCAERVAREAAVLEAFARGWTVSRVYYGAPAYAPLDEIAFLHRRGLLEPYLAAAAPPRLGECAARWAEERPEAVAAYREWRREEFGGGDGPGPVTGRAAAVPGSPGRRGAPPDAF